MIVEITNVTDGPGRTPTQVDIYNKTLDPGVSIKLPAELVDRKVRALEKQGLICIGQVPAWYLGAKTRKGRSLSAEERQKRIVKAAPVPEPVPLKTPEPKKEPAKDTSPEDHSEEAPETSDRKRRR